MKKLKLKTINKSWGNEIFVWNKGRCTKIISIERGKDCGWHYHKLKDETIYVLTGSVLIMYSTKDDLKFSCKVMLKAKEAIHIPEKLRHQVFSLEENTVIIESSSTHYDSDCYMVGNPGKRTGDIC